LVDYTDFVAGDYETQIRNVFHQACGRLGFGLWMVAGPRFGRAGSGQ
jgi:hypothetical protein